MGDAPLTVDPTLDKYIEPEPNSGCWIWVAGHFARGYGCVKRDRRAQCAHRYIYQLLHGTLDQDQTLDHLYRNHPCVNPDHLEPVSQRENVLRGNWGGAVNARKTHCSKGHEYNAENTIYWRTHRLCRLCNRLRYLRSTPAVIKGRYRSKLAHVVLG